MKHLHHVLPEFPLNPHTKHLQVTCLDKLDEIVIMISDTINRALNTKSLLERETLHEDCLRDIQIMLGQYMRSL